LVGAGRFADLEELPAVGHNLTDLAAALTDKDTGILPPDRVTIVADPDSPGRMMRELRAAARQAEDFFLVYYAGHGVRHPRRHERLYLAVRETESDGPDGTAVSFESVRDVIEDSMARTRVLILDCCYSGMAVGAMSGSPVDAHEVAVGGTAVMTSSPPNSISLAPPGDRHTAFTGELITLLREGSRVPGEPLTVGTAFRSLQSVLAERKLPAPKLRVTDTSSDILLRKPPPPPPPEPAVPQPVPPARQPGLAGVLVMDFGWFLLRAGIAVGLALIVGGFGNAIVGNGGATNGVVGVSFVVAFGLPIAVRTLQLQQYGRPRPRPGDLSPALARARTPLLTIGFVAFVVIAVVGAISPLPPVSGGTGVSPITNITMVCLCAEAALVCAYSLWRGKGASPVSGDAPPRTIQT
jgi:hypothetical protein